MTKTNLLKTSYTEYRFILSITLILGIFLGGCKTVQRDLLFETPIDYRFDTSKTYQKESYKIQTGDRIMLQVYTNDGYDLIRSGGFGIGSYGGGAYGGSNYQSQYGSYGNYGGGGSYGGNYNQYNNRSGNQNYGNGYGSEGYLIEPDGTAKLPIVGNLTLQGLNYRETEKLLEDKYSEYVNKPYIKLQVLNRRVYILGAINTVYYLINEHTTLLEALSTLGGLPSKGAKSYNIKLIRGDLNNPEVKLINLSTIKGAKDSELLLKANDVIYIEPVRRLTETITEELGLIVGLINSVTGLILIFSVFFIKSE